jgi:hypothetical protein
MRKFGGIGHDNLAPAERLMKSLADAVLEFTQEIVSDAVNEVRGNISAFHVREWVRAQSPGSGAVKCFLHYDKNSRFLSLTLLSNDDSFIFDSNGKRMAVAFKVNSLDIELEDLLRNESSLILKI